MTGAPTALGGAVVGTARRVASSLGLTILAAVAAACGGGDTAITGVSDAVASLTITADSHAPGSAPSSGGPFSVEVGDSLSLSATGTNALGLAISGVAAVWSSSSPSVVSVSGAGVAKALAPGSADVYAAVDGVSATARISVSDTTTAPPPISAGS